MTTFLRKRDLIRPAQVILAIVSASAVWVPLTVLATQHRPSATSAIVGALTVVVALGAVVFWLRHWPTRRQSRIAAHLGMLSTGGWSVVQPRATFAALAGAALVVNGGYLALFHSPRLLMLNGVVVATAAAMAALRLADVADLATAAAAFWLICYPNLSVPLIIWGMTQATATYVQRAEQDPLTGLLNRRAFAESVDDRLNHHAAAHTHLAVMMADLDDFKRINDTSGHVAGDRLLQVVAGLLRDHAPADAIICRAGGEEFLIALTCATADVAPLAARICTAIAEHPSGITASIGTARAELHRLCTSDGGDLVEGSLSSPITRCMRPNAAVEIRLCRARAPSSASLPLAASSLSVAPAARITDVPFRNVAIVAHVDHGKTTLVDAMLRQSGALTHRGDDTVERLMDSGDLEKEKGITILAKNTAVHRKNPDGSVTVINVIDTPGHADFGGEVERGLSMVDGVLLLVDASEGPLPQTRFVLRKALAAHLPVILVVNKTDRPDARIAEVVSESHDLLLDVASDLDTEAQRAAEDALGLPTLYASGRAGIASITEPANGENPDGSNLDPLFDVLLENIPPPQGDPEAPLQALVTNLDASAFLGRLALIRIYKGRIRKGQQVAWMREVDGHPVITNAKITELLVTEGVERTSTDEAVAGDIVAVAGLPEIMIGDTLADPDHAHALPRITVDEPAISVTVGTNTSPLAGKVSGHKLTARMVKSRLDTELVGNVSIKVVDIDRPDAWEVQGRGELALAVLVEQMRREGFELTVGKPQVVTRTVDGKLHEPFEAMTIDCPDEFVGAITQLMAARKGRMEEMANHAAGWVRMDFIVPSRGLIGFRTDFLTLTRGTGIANAVFDGYRPWAGEIRARHTGSLVSDRTGSVTPFAMIQLSDRGQFFVEPGDDTYEGQVVGINPRAEDLDVNVTREKKLTNMRSSTADVFETLAKPLQLDLEQAMEFCANDECVEVTPEIVRVRKVELDATSRARSKARAKARG